MQGLRAEFNSSVCGNASVGTMATQPRSPLWHRSLKKRRQTSVLCLCRNCVAPAGLRRITDYHGSCLPGAMTQKGRRQQKEWERWKWVTALVPCSGLICSTFVFVQTVQPALWLSVDFVFACESSTEQFCMCSVTSYCASGLVIQWVLSP